ncbi:hypothetical protein P7C70_g9095, partial [Phenoliferia sp. Uapishka_3]
MGSALVLGLESIGCDSPAERRLGKPAKTKGVQWRLTEVTPLFIALCVLGIHWKLSGVANFQAESQKMKFAKLYRQIRNQLTVTDETPGPTSDRCAEVMRFWNTTLFDRTGDYESDDDYVRADVDFEADFAAEFEEEEEQDGAGDDGDGSGGMGDE